MQTVEVHNVWTIYGLDADGIEVEQPIAQMWRPQDWGHPKWHYEQFRFDWITEDTHYINHVHCWTDLKPSSRGEYPMMFAPLVVQIAMPGTDPRLCAKEYLDEEDFWNEAWGEMPPYIDEEEE